MSRPLDFAATLIAWQRTHGRHDLPWQRTRDPYRVWLSEVMLQQTQVATVLPYYGRFLDRFPDVTALAAAPLEDVLALWSGLGYYSRARNLHRCAQAVVADHGGAFPRTAQALAALPGIGPSTAAAIAAFCHGERAAILDGNVKRVLARWLAFDGDLAEAGPVRTLWQRAEALLPHRDVDIYTQGLMDLGATLCTPREPRCGDCPVARGCCARAAGDVLRYPVKTRRQRRGERRNAWLWLVHRDRVWLGRRPDRGVWARLWSLPEYADSAALLDAAAGWPGRAEVLPTLRHALTHFDWWLTPHRWVLPARTTSATLERIAAQLAGPAGEGRWFTRAEALAAGIPAPLRRLLEEAQPPA